MFIISNHYGRKCISMLLQLEPCNDIFKVILDIMAHWYVMIITIIITINFRNAIKMNTAFMLL